MKHLMHAVAVAALLVGVPALGQELRPVVGSDRDPFSDRYTGGASEEPGAGDVRSTGDARREANRDEVGSSRCDRSCDCGHHGEKGMHSKA